MLITAFLPVTPASATHAVIGVSVSENLDWQATYAPNSDGSNGAIPVGTVSGTGSVTITNNAGIQLNDVDIVLNAGSTDLVGGASWTQTGGTGTAAITKNSGANTVDVKVKTFGAGQTVVLSYGVLSTATAPITLSATYSANRISDNVGTSTDVTLTATAATGVTVSPTITVTSANNPARGSTTTPDWTLTSTASGVAANGDSSALTWTVGALSSGTPKSMTFTAAIRDTGALDDTTNQISLNDMATSDVTYTITGSAQSSAGVGVASMYSTSAEVTTRMDKKLVNGQWTFTPAVAVPAAGTAIAYELDTVSVWAVDGSSLNTVITPPGTMTIDGAHTNNGESWPFVFDKATGWTGVGAELLQFAYDGIPVGFMKPTLKIYDDPAHAQYTRSYTSADGTVTLVKKIYVINGYEVQVVKTITPGSSEGQYHITVVATNVGNKATPPHVYIYDIIPEGFTPTFTGTIHPVNEGSPTAVSNAGVVGNAYYWDLNQLAAHESQTITYDVSGSGTYTAADLYVVGVDPAQSLNLQTMPSLQNASVLVSSNFETLAALGAAGLLLVGMFGTFRRKL